MIDDEPAISDSGSLYFRRKITVPQECNCDLRIKIMDKIKQLENCIGWEDYKVTVRILKDLMK